MDRMRKYMPLVLAVVFAAPSWALAQEGEGAPTAPTADQTVVASAPETKEVAPVKVEEKKPVVRDEKTKAQAKELVAKKSEEMRQLQLRAMDVTARIGELATSGKLPTNEESVELMRKMVQELDEIREQLQKIQEQIDEINGWIEGQNESLPIIAQDVENLKRVTFGSYLQFQYVDNQNAGAGDGFALRRFRFSQTYRVDPRTQIRWSFDMATGANRVNAEMRDAILQYDIEPTTDKIGIELLAGQQALPLGYELERSSAEREMPERTSYNRRLFNGERGRGVNFRFGLTPGSFAHFGVWNNLTNFDPQQTGTAVALSGSLPTGWSGLTSNRSQTFRNLNGTDLAFSGGFRWFGTNYDLGLSGFIGKRAAEQVSATFNNTTQRVNIPEVDRQIFYADATFVGVLLPQIVLRGEFMWGRDRDPLLRARVSNNQLQVAFPGEADVMGYQAQLSYNINARNGIHVRYDFYDPDRDFNRDSIATWGYAYTYFINPGARLTIAYETPREGGDSFRAASVRDDGWTVRLQFRFQ